MDYNVINPRIYSISLYERPGRAGECVSYSSKLIYLISGEITYTAGGGKRMRMAPGNLLYLPAGVVYSLKSKYMRAVVVSFDFCDSGKVDYVPPVPAEEFDAGKCAPCIELPAFLSPLLLSDLESERDTFIRMSNIFASANGNYIAELSAHLKLILLKLAEHTDEDALPSSMVENLDGYIRDNIHDEISNTELGAIFGYHPFYISKLLKDRRGITLHQYVLSFRFKRAAELLANTDKPIADIADAAGFTDAPYFSKTFKARFGVTPKEYRARFQGEFI